jgi:hypothetical protein
MGRPISIQLGEEIFRTKGDLIARVRKLIERYPLMGLIDGDDKELCLNLFKHHPEYSKKIGVGILSIQVRISEEHSTRHFHLHRNDGTDEEISWTKCVASIK